MLLHFGTSALYHARYGYSILNLLKVIEQIEIDMIKITRTFSIPEHEIEEQFIRASGPGGQKVNKTSSAVQLQFGIKESSVLPDKIKTRLITLAGNRVTSEGILVIESSEHRSQQRNRETARKKLAHLVRQALRPPRSRKKTRPTNASKEERLKNKRIRARKKQLRKSPKRNE